MTPAKPTLRVTPELCDECRDRDCVRACKQRAIRAGKGFVYVDWERCDGCLACVEMCETGALQARGASLALAGAPVRPTAGPPPLEQRGDGAPGRRVTDDPNRLGSVASSTSDEGVWTRADALVALVLMLATLSMLNVVLNTRLVALMPSSGRVFARAGGLSLAYLIEIVAIWLLARRHGVVMVQAVGLRPLFRSSKTAAISTVAVLVLLVVTRGISTVYSMITEALKWQPTFRWSADLTQVFGHGRAGLILTIALVVLVGPLVEEMAFRGVAQSALKTRWGAWPSILATSVLFAVYHFDPWMFLPTFVLGLGLGWLTENRRGLWPAVALHVLYNGITVVAVFWLAAQ